MKRWCYALGLVLLAACDSGGAQPSTTIITDTTTAVATPTTPPPTTAAVPPTTAATTTTPPTTAAPTPAEIAQTEIRATLDSLYTDLDTCYAAPDTCDIDTLLGNYFASGDDVARGVYNDLWEGLATNGNRKVVDGRFERTYSWIISDANGQNGTSYMCEIDNSFSVPNDAPSTADNSIPPDLQSTYVRVYFEWERQPNNSWLITRSEGNATRTPESFVREDLPSLTGEEIAQCF